MQKLTESDILLLIQEDEWMMEILRAAESLHLPDWWIGAGFVRSKVWDYLSGYKKRTPLPDVDLIYLDKNDFTGEENEFSTKKEESYQEKLANLNDSVKWSVTNQARMHLVHHTKPYKSSSQALADWSETATCVGVKLEKGSLKLTAPHGIDDLVNLIVRPIPNYSKKYSYDQGLFKKRVGEKKWIEKWPKLKVLS